MGVDVQRFLDKEAPLQVAVRGQTSPLAVEWVGNAKARQFQTGSLGWYGSGRTNAWIDGEDVQVMLSITVTVMGTKNQDGAKASAQKTPKKKNGKTALVKEEVSESFLSELAQLKVTGDKQGNQPSEEKTPEYRHHPVTDSSSEQAHTSISLSSQQPPANPSGVGTPSRPSQVGRYNVTPQRSGEAIPAPRRSPASEISSYKVPSSTNSNPFEPPARPRGNITPSRNPSLYKSASVPEEATCTTASQSTRREVPQAYPAKDNYSHLDRYYRRTLSFTDADRESSYLDAMFFPDKSGKHVDQLLAWISAAKFTLDICMYALTHDRFKDELLAAHSRGVKVRVVADYKMAKLKGSDVAELFRAGVDLRLGGTLSYESMHHKFCIVDSRLLITGSFNWTVQASKRNKENVLIITEPSVIRMFEEEFNRLHNQTANDPGLIQALYDNKLREDDAEPPGEGKDGVQKENKN